MYAWAVRRTDGSWFLSMVAALFVMAGWGTLLLGVARYLSGGQPSHLSLAFESLRHEGWSYLLPALRRKLALHQSLMGWTPFTYALLVALGAVGWLLFRGPGPFLRFRRRRPFFTRSAFGLTCTAFVAWVVNDSGISMAATLALMLGPVLWSVWMEEDGETPMVPPSGRSEVK